MKFEELLEKVRNNDASIKSINLRTLEDYKSLEKNYSYGTRLLRPEQTRRLARAMKGNTHLVSARDFRGRHEYHNESVHLTVSPYYSPICKRPLK